MKSLWTTFLVGNLAMCLALAGCVADTSGGENGDGDTTPTNNSPNNNPNNEPNNNPNNDPNNSPNNDPNNSPNNDPNNEPGPECGNDVCEEGESVEDCAADCGEDQDPFCGDGACNGTENENVCAEDCAPEGPVCGDETCEDGEDALSCPEDCEDEGPYCTPDSREICDDNIDNNCNELVDEGCTCTVAEKPCYTGDPRDLEGETACRAGVQRCEREFYGECIGEVTPTEEICDGIDNDCNGQIDEVEGCNNTPPEAVCPPDQTGPTLANYTLIGGYNDADGDPMVRSTWTLLDSPVGSTASPNPPNALTTGFFADVQGIYLFQLEVEDSTGNIGRCTARVETNSEDQLRVELVWNVGANNDRSDIDLHLLKTPGARWFTNGNRGEDCFWENCRVCDEGYNQPPEQYEAACRQQIAEFNADPNTSPPPQVEWFSPLDDNDPRLDLDDVEGNGPENVNIKTPLNGTYRLGVHYWADDGFGDSTATVRIFCRGNLAREFEPVVLRASDGQDGGPDTEFWEVADIVWTSQGCEIQEFGTAGCREICTRREVDANLGCPDGLSRGQTCR